MVEGGVVGGGLVERPGDPEGSGTVSGYRVVSGPGEVPDPGVSSEVGERPVVAAGAEGSEVSSLGEVGGGVEEGSGVSAAPTVASRVDTGRPGVEVRSALSREAGSGLGGRVSAGGEVASVDRDAARGVSCGAAWEATGGPGEGAGGAVLAAVGRSRRSGPGFFPGPAGGEMDGEVSLPRPPHGQGSDGQSEGAGPRDVIGRRQIHPPSCSPFPRPCRQAPPGGLHCRRVQG